MTISNLRVEKIWGFLSVENSEYNHNNNKHKDIFGAHWDLGPRP